MSSRSASASEEDVRSSAHVTHLLGTAAPLDAFSKVVHGLGSYDATSGARQGFFRLIDGSRTSSRARSRSSIGSWLPGARPLRGSAYHS